jgi:solute carrier family 39 (zinc transporter), member 7
MIWGFDRAGVWLSAMGCSLLVSMASLVCLVLLPVIFCECPRLARCNLGIICLPFCAGPDCLVYFNSAVKGKPSKAIVDSLAVFGVSGDCAAL